jgi:surface carbohydrate biosynthesis protein
MTDPRFSLYIPIELKNRELASQVILACKAAELGFRTYIGSHSTIHTLLRHKPGVGGVYLDKGTLPFEKMMWIKSRCESIAILDQELGPTEENPLAALSEWPGRVYPDTEYLIDRFYCVSEFVQKSALEFFGRSGKSNVPKLTGWPRIDLWKLGISNEQKKRVTKIQKKYGDFFLYASSFGWLNEKAISQDIENSKKYQMTWDQQKNHFQILDNFHDTIKTLRNWDSIDEAPKIVVRPHISENLALWKKSLGSMRKTHVVHRGNIADWILASKGVIHEGSTAALEAFIRGRTVYYLEHEGIHRRKELTHELSQFLVSINVHPGILVTNDILKRSKHKESLLSTRVYLGENPSTNLIVSDLSDLQGCKEEEISRFDFILRSLSFRGARRIVGLIKWEFASLLSLTLSSPPSRTLGVLIRKRDIQEYINLYAPQHRTVLKRVSINLWKISS